jgi:hypothetical protein
MDFKQYLQEASEKTAVMAFGRFNPPTVGHEKLIQKVKEEADERGASGNIFASHAQNTDKDPLPQKAKLGFLNRIAYGNTIHGSSKDEPTFLHAAAKLYKQGHKHLVMVAGSDRANEYKEKLERYNDGKDYPHGKYKFKSINVISAGSRDPDAEGVEGISGTKMREFARKGNMGKFKSNLPEGLQDHSEEIASHITKATGVTKAAAAKKENFNPWIKEDYENPYRFDRGTPEGTKYMQSMTPGQKIQCTVPGEVWSDKLGMCVPLREAYVNYDILKLEDFVQAKNGETGKIVYRGSTYVTLQLENKKTVKHWIQDIVETISERTAFGNALVEPRKIQERQTPALFKPRKLEENSGSLELEYGGYRTSSLHMCKDASDQLKGLITKGLNPKYVLQAIQATDQYLGIEKYAKQKNFANEQVVNDFIMKLTIAHDTLNLLGYADADLQYMMLHIKEMAKLSMHKDKSFANEPGLAEGSLDDIEDTRQFKNAIALAKSQKTIRHAKHGKDTKFYADGTPVTPEETARRAAERKARKQGVAVHGVGDIEEGIDVSDYKIVIGKDGKKYKVHPKRIITDKDPQMEGRDMNNYKQVLDTISELYEPDEPTSERDINRTPEKEVFHGIDKTIDNQGGGDLKAPGFVSFKSYLSSPETKNIEAKKDEQMQAVHRQKAQLMQQSPAYKLMRKKQQADDV